MSFPSCFLQAKQEKGAAKCVASVPLLKVVHPAVSRKPHVYLYKHQVVCFSVQSSVNVLHMHLLQVGPDVFCVYSGIVAFIIVRSCLRAMPRPLAQRNETVISCMFPRRDQKPCRWLGARICYELKNGEP